VKINRIRLYDARVIRIAVRLGMNFRATAAVLERCDDQRLFYFIYEELLPRLEHAKTDQRRLFMMRPTSYWVPFYI
jgi:hypothetical protein